MGWYTIFVCYIITIATTLSLSYEIQKSNLFPNALHKYIFRNQIAKSPPSCFACERKQQSLLPLLTPSTTYYLFFHVTTVPHIVKKPVITKLSTRYLTSRFGLKLASLEAIKVSPLHIIFFAKSSSSNISFSIASSFILAVYRQSLDIGSMWMHVNFSSPYCVETWWT